MESLQVYLFATAAHMKRPKVVPKEVSGRKVLPKAVSGFNQFHFPAFQSSPYEF